MPDPLADLAAAVDRIRHEPRIPPTPSPYLVPAHLWDELEKLGNEEFIRRRDRGEIVRNRIEDINA